MKNRFKVLVIPFSLLVIIIVIATGCKKDETNPDFASSIASTYNGTFTASGIGSLTGASTLAKVSDTMVNLTLTISGQNISLNGIIVSSPSKDAYSLTLSDSSGSFTGTVQGKTLNYTMTSGTDIITFTGTR